MAVTQLARTYVSQPGNASGGRLHIVLADYNVDDGHLLFCWAACKGEHDFWEGEDAFGAAIVLLLLTMTRTQRLKVAHECWHP